MRQRTWFCRLGRACAGVLLAMAAVAEPDAARRPDDPPAADGGASDVYRPDLAVPEMLEPYLPYIEPGHDAFALERDAEAIEARLRELGDALRAGRPDDAASLLAPDLRGAPLLPARSQPAQTHGPLEIRRARRVEETASLDRERFRSQLSTLTAGMRRVLVTEFIVTAIAPADGPGRLDTVVRFDLVGDADGEGRVQHTGTWRMSWRRGGDRWQIASWSTLSQTTSRARRPVFVETTRGAFGGIDAFRRQLSVDLDSWMATFDSVLTRDSNGHHGVSAGDADGDGLDDLYVAQPSGLPNRLFRARGDGTFEDITERAGLAVLDDTAQSLFADVDNDGDQDLVIATGTRPLLFVNEGTGRFAPVPDAFRFARPLQGALTSMAMADYDRDGFLDLYLCVYSYFYGAGEEKAGTPAPYYDARNGPPAVLFRNDGTGRFVDVTEQAGLEAGNDRYHFAAAWADVDGDGWPDLYVANDFGTNNLYRNRGRVNGTVTFEDVAAPAGVLDHGAGMSATFLDYDNDGRLDIYTGNMWTASGQRVTASPAFMPDAPADVRALYRRHARGNALHRNRGDGTFDDVTVDAGVAMGRWAWSSDALDFDSDGWDDLYVVNGMLTRTQAEHDLEGFFWRQVVARSPLTRVPGTPYDGAWRAINQLLIHENIAGRQRNVFLRNDGAGAFDDVSGAVGLDLDQDGRSFAALDVDGDGDPDLAVMAARQAPHLRLFRNDVTPRGRALAIRLTGTTSNRDAIGARVVVETDRLRRTKVLMAGSGFLSQHSKELLVGLGDSSRVETLTVFWPSGERQVFTNLPVDVRLRLVEGGPLEQEPFAASTAGQPPGADLPRTPASAPRATWLYEPFPAPDLSLPDLAGTTRSLAAMRGRPAVLLLWSAGSTASRAAVEGLARGRVALERAGIGVLALALDPPDALARVRQAAPAGLPVAQATREAGIAFAIMNRHVFMNRQPLRLPAAFLLDGEGRVVRAYRGAVEPDAIVADAAVIDAPAAERLARALPFPGQFHAPIGRRNYLPYGRELLDQGLDAAAVVAFERAAQANPSAPTLYRLGTLLVRGGEPVRARAAFERALAMQPDLAEASNDLGALLAQDGDLEGAIARFRAALDATPDYPDALNNLGYAMLLTGQQAEARKLYERALALQPDFPEALNNLGLLYGRSGDLDRAERYFRDALARRAGYGEAANNLALVLVARGDEAGALALLDDFLQRTPEFEGAYVTLARIHLAAGRRREGIGALERLLQRNPRHPLGLELLDQVRSQPAP
ncbi:MAG TPA: FG-GAP-like repeat-containing protein [Vicinamibacterales bacterium]